MKKLFTKEGIIGLSIVAAIAVLVFGIDFLKGINVFTPTNHYYSTYTDVQGLVTSAPVTVNGFKVGLVHSIEYQYDNPGHVKVLLSLNKELKVPEGTKAIITADILGTASVVLDMAHNNNFLPVGSDLEGVSDAGLMASVSENLLPTVASALPKVDTLLSHISTLVGDPALLASVKRLDAITASLQATAGNLNALTQGLKPAVAGVGQVLTNVDTLTSNLASVSATVKQAPIDSLLANLEVATANLRAMSDELGNPNSSLGLLMHDPALYNNLNATVTSLDSLFVDIKRNPKRYVTIKVF